MPFHLYFDPGMTGPKWVGLSGGLLSVIWLMAIGLACRYAWNQIPFSQCPRCHSYDIEITGEGFDRSQGSKAGLGELSFGSYCAPFCAPDFLFPASRITYETLNEKARFRLEAKTHPVLKTRGDKDGHLADDSILAKY